MRISKTNEAKILNHLKGLKDVKTQLLKEGKKNVYVFTVKASEKTPLMQQAIGFKTPRVHVATYVPSTNKVFLLSKRYAVKK